MKTKKTFISVFAIIALVAVLVISCVACQQIKDGADKAKDKVNELVDKAKDKVNNLELAVENNPRLSLAMADNSAVEEDSYVVTATFNTDFEELKKATWSLSFADTTVTENVEDYVTKTTSEDTLSCTVKMVKPFEKVIILTCKNETYSNISAKCQLDCNLRLDQKTVYLSNLNDSIALLSVSNQKIAEKFFSNNPWSSGSVRSIPAFSYNSFPNVTTFQKFKEFYVGALSYDAVTNTDIPLERQIRSKCTIDGTVSIKAYVKPSEEFYSALSTYGLAKDTLDEYIVKQYGSNIGGAITLHFYDVIISMLSDTSFNTILNNYNSSIINNLAKAMYSCKDKTAGILVVKATTNLDSKEYSFPFTFDVSMIAGEDVVGVEVDNSNIAF